MLLATADNIWALVVADKIVLGRGDPFERIHDPDLSFGFYAVIDHKTTSPGVAGSDAPKSVSSENLALEDPEDTITAPEPKYPASHNVGLAADRLDLVDGRWFSAVAVSSHGTYVAAANNFKTLFVYRVPDDINGPSDEVPLLRSWSLSKRTMAMVFTTDETSVIVADKLGDVYIYGLHDEESKIHLPVLGHISVITDVVLTPDNRFIVTSDRDEKVRISHFPFSDDIQTFCLGHTEFVSKIVVPLSSYPLIVSGAGDGSLRAFNYMTGDQIGMLLCSPDIGIKSRENERFYVVALAYFAEKNVLITAFHGSDELVGYNLDLTITEGLISGATFNQCWCLHAAAPVRAVAVFGNSLIILRDDTEDPLICFRNLEGIRANGEEQRPFFSIVGSLRTLLKDTIKNVIQENRLKSLFRDPYADLFSVNNQPVPDGAGVATDVKIAETLKKKTLTGTKRPRIAQPSENMDVV